MFAHGAQKLWGWFDGYGPHATGLFLESLGYRPGRRMAILAGLTEAGGGAFNVLGLLTPFAAAAILGVMVNAIGSVHWEKGAWADKGGFEYPLLISTVCAALGFAGPGRYSLDAASGLYLDGVWGLTTLLIGFAVGLTVLSARRLEEPVQEAPTIHLPEAALEHARR